MATLTSNSLDNCTSIPDFIPAGTTMVFSSTNAPPSWTKSVSHNNKALRLVTGGPSPGGTTAFTSPGTSVFPASQRPVAGSINAANSAATFGPETISSSTGLVNAYPTIGIDARTIDTSYMAIHAHSYNRRNTGVNTADQAGSAPVSKDTLETVAFGGSGGGGSHSHGWPATPQHNHGVSATAHSHTVQNPGPHLHGFATTAQDFAIKYVDVVVGIKDL